MTQCIQTLQENFKRLEAINEKLYQALDMAKAWMGSPTNVGDIPVFEQIDDALALKTGETRAKLIIKYVGS